MFYWPYYDAPRRRLRLRVTRRNYYERGRDCFLDGVETGRYRCSRRGMEALRECMYINHGGNIGNNYCGPVSRSVVRAVLRLRRQYPDYYRELMADFNRNPY